MNHPSSTFPDHYRTIPTEQLVAVFRAGPERLRQVVDGLSAEAQRARPISSKWSTVEIIAHVIDAELVGTVRFRLVWAEPGSALPVYDQDLWSARAHYQELDPETIGSRLFLFQALRQTTLDLIEGASAAQWEQTGIHPAYGSVTLRQLLELYADHSERHVEQIAARRSLLGSPVTIQPLLTPRLY